MEKAKRAGLALAALLALYGFVPFLIMGAPAIFLFAQQTLHGESPKAWSALPKAAGLLVHLFGVGAGLSAARRGTGLGRGFAVLAVCYGLSFGVAALTSFRR